MESNRKIGARAEFSYQEECGSGTDFETFEKNEVPKMKLSVWFEKIPLNANRVFRIGFFYSVVSPHSQQRREPRRF